MNFVLRSSTTSSYCTSRSRRTSRTRASLQKSSVGVSRRGRLSHHSSRARASRVSSARCAIRIGKSRHIARSLFTRREPRRRLFLLRRSTSALALAALLPTLSREFQSAPHPRALHLIRRSDGVHDAVGRGLQGSKNRHRARDNDVVDARALRGAALLSSTTGRRNGNGNGTRPTDGDARANDKTNVYKFKKTHNSHDGDEFDVKVQRGVRRNHAAGAALTVPELGGNDELPLPPDAHGR